MVLYTKKELLFYCFLSFIFPLFFSLFFNYILYIGFIELNNSTINQIENRIKICDGLSYDYEQDIIYCNKGKYILDFKSLKNE